LPPLPHPIDNVATWVEEQLQSSLNRLQVESVYGFLLHRPADLAGRYGQSLAEAIANLKREGLVHKVGVSIYSPLELESAFDFLSIDLVQSPYNLFDQRLQQSGWLVRLKEEGIEVHARSIFLQGLLIMKRNEMPKAFDRWSCLWESYHNWLSDNDITALEACLAFAASNPMIDKLVLGVDSAKQLSEILRTMGKGNFVDGHDFRCEDEMLLNPSFWDLS